MDSLTSLINELSELRRFKCDILVTLIYNECSRKTVSYGDQDLDYIADCIRNIIKENNELKDRLAQDLQVKQK